MTHVEILRSRESACTDCTFRSNPKLLTQPHPHRTSVLTHSPRCRLTCHSARFEYRPSDNNVSSSVAAASNCPAHSPPPHTTSLRRDMPTPGKRAIPIRTREGSNEGSFEKSTGVCAQSYRDEGAKRRWLGRGYRTVAGHDNSRELEPITKAI
jgi:hypothetical protein